MLRERGGEKVNWRRGEDESEMGICGEGEKGRPDRLLHEIYYRDWCL